MALWVDRYDPERQAKLANFITTHCLTHGAGLQTVAKLQQERRLVESGAAMSFSCGLFKEFLSRATVEKLNRALKEGKAQSLIFLLPSSKRTPANLYKALEEEELIGFAKWIKAHTRDKRVEDTQEKIEEELADISSLEETTTRLQLLKNQYVLGDSDIVVCVFRGIMGLADLSGKKPAKEMTAHLVAFSELLEPFCNSTAAERSLMQALCDYMQDEDSLMEGFMVTCKELYDADVLGEDSILAWVEHKTNEADPDMQPFLTQMAPFVSWLQEADESSEEEDD
jgi:hypothetical protein